MLADSAQLVAIKKKIFVSVEHGWKKFAGPFVITESDHNVIKMIDYQPAFEVYKKAIEQDDACKFSKKNFFNIAKGHPFGIEKIDGSFIVRDPIAEKNDQLVCVADVPENSFVYILKGETENLIGAAAKAARAIESKLPTKKRNQSVACYPAILFDCISRFLILQEEFGGELNAINHCLPDITELIGVSTIGEIANYGDFCLEFYNKTLILSLFKED